MSLSTELSPPTNNKNGVVSQVCRIGEQDVHRDRVMIYQQYPFSIADYSVPARKRLESRVWRPHGVNSPAISVNYGARGRFMYLCRALLQWGKYFCTYH